MEKEIIIPSFLAEKQRNYLNNLITRSKGDDKALFAVKAIIKTIEVVEFFYKDSGQEVLKGAHIVVKNPDIYKKLINNTKSRKRISSHYKSEKIQEKGVDLKDKSDFLVGLNKDDMAWLQLERHKVSFEDGLIRGAILLILHMIDYLKYKFTGKNVGPCGLSEYVQIKPIHIPTKPGDILDGLGDFFTLDERMSSQTKTPDGNRDKKSFIARINDERQNQKELRLPIFSINDSNHIG